MSIHVAVGPDGVRVIVIDISSRHDVTSGRVGVNVGAQDDLQVCDLVGDGVVGVESITVVQVIIVVYITIHGTYGMSLLGI